PATDRRVGRGLVSAMTLRVARLGAVALLLAALVVAAAPAQAAQATRPHVIATVPVGDGPSGIGVNPRTNRAYVADYRADTLSVIDGSTNTVIATIDVGSGPAAVGVNPVNNRIYVALQTEGVAVVDGRTTTLFTTTPLGTAPHRTAG